MKRSAFVVLSLSLVACVPPVAPAALVIRAPTAVNASFGRAWDATIDAFASRGISIETLDRSSGLIVPAGRTYAPGATAHEALLYADCGKSMFGVETLPGSVKYNVVVRGDSTSSTVLVRAFYQSYAARGDVATECTSRGKFEAEAEANIKSAAERTAAR